jgi:hypothetical protein
LFISSSTLEIIQSFMFFSSQAVSTQAQIAAIITNSAASAAQNAAALARARSLTAASSGSDSSVRERPNSSPTNLLQRNNSSSSAHSFGSGVNSPANAALSPFLSTGGVIPLSPTGHTGHGTLLEQVQIQIRDLAERLVTTEDARIAAVECLNAAMAERENERSFDRWALSRQAALTQAAVERERAAQAALASADERNEHEVTVWKTRVNALEHRLVELESEVRRNRASFRAQVQHPSGLPNVNRPRGGPPTLSRPASFSISASNSYGGLLRVPQANDDSESTIASAASSRQSSPSVSSRASSRHALSPLALSQPSVSPALAPLEDF